MIDEVEYGVYDDDYFCNSFDDGDMDIEEQIYYAGYDEDIPDH